MLFLLLVFCPVAMGTTTALQTVEYETVAVGCFFQLAGCLGIHDSTSECSKKDCSRLLVYNNSLAWKLLYDSTKIQ